MKQQESQTHISFVLDEDEQVSTLGMKMLGQMEGKNVAKLSPGRHFGTYGGWEIGINTETGVVYHVRLLQ